jgi:pre-mRNA cleavage complex 2 protein Pcf11
MPEDQMKAHMDWHFRRNRKDRDGQGRGAHRKWLPRAEVGHELSRYCDLLM